MTDRRSLSGLAAPLVALASAGVACSSTNIAATPTPSPSPVPAATQASPSPTSRLSVSPAAQTTPTASTDLADGRSFGYVKDVQSGSRSASVVFDLAQFFTGAAADQAAVEDGVIQPGDHVPNDHYIRNVNPRLRTLLIDHEVMLIVIDWTNCCHPVPGNLHDFVSAFTAGASHDGPYRGPGSQYWLTLAGSRVVKIEEQYLP